MYVCVSPKASSKVTAGILNVYVTKPNYSRFYSYASYPEIVHHYELLPWRQVVNLMLLHTCVYSQLDNSILEEISNVIVLHDICETILLL